MRSSASRPLASHVFLVPAARSSSSTALVPDSVHWNVHYTATRSVHTFAPSTATQHRRPEPGTAASVLANRQMRLAEASPALYGDDPPENRILQRRLPWALRKQMTKANELLENGSAGAQNAYSPSPIVTKLNLFVSEVARELQELGTNGKKSLAPGGKDAPSPRTHARTWNALMQSLLEKKTTLEPADCCNVLTVVCEFLYCIPGAGTEEGKSVQEVYGRVLARGRGTATGTSSSSSTAPASQRERETTETDESGRTEELSMSLEESKRVAEEAIRNFAPATSDHVSPQKSDGDHDVFPNDLFSDGTPPSKGNEEDSTRFRFPTAAFDESLSEARKRARLTPRHLRRLQKQIQKEALSRNGANLEITSAVVEQCLNVLARPSAAGTHNRLPPVLAAETLKTLQIVSKKGKPEYVELVWEIHARLLRLLSIAVEESEKADAVDEDRQHTPQHRLLARKRGKDAARRDIEQRSHALPLVELRAIYVGMAAAAESLFPVTGSAVEEMEDQTSESGGITMNNDEDPVSVMWRVAGKKRSSCWGGAVQSSSPPLNDLITTLDDESEEPHSSSAGASSAGFLVTEIQQALTKKVQTPDMAAQHLFLLPFCWLRLHPEFRHEKKDGLFLDRIRQKIAKVSRTDGAPGAGLVNEPGRGSGSSTRAAKARAATCLNKRERERFEILRVKQADQDDMVRESGLLYLCAQGIEGVIRGRLVVSPLDAIAALEAFSVLERCYPKLRQKLAVFVPDLLRRCREEELLEALRCLASPAATLGCFDNCGVELLAAVAEERGILGR